MAMLKVSLSLGRAEGMLVRTGTEDTLYWMESDQIQTPDNSLSTFFISSISLDNGASDGSWTFLILFEPRMYVEKGVVQENLHCSILSIFLSGLVVPSAAATSHVWPSSTWNICPAEMSSRYKIHVWFQRTRMYFLYWLHTEIIFLIYYWFK